MLDQNTTDATSALIASDAPRIAERTGTAVRPRPGSRAMRTPAEAAGEPTVRVATLPRVAVRSASTVPPVAAANRPARSAGRTARSMTTAATQTAPIRSTGTAAAKPGCGSASRASPIGVRGDRQSTPRPIDRGVGAEENSGLGTGSNKFGGC